MTEPEAYLATSQARSSTSCDSAYSMHSGYLATTLSPPLGRMGARIAAMAHHSNDGNHAAVRIFIGKMFGNIEQRIMSILEYFKFTGMAFISNQAKADYARRY
ncbi:hypothetical protein HZH66_000874 [Vespula vulgaris]|uniref:Uncharacterized protein n=1 Tax=Vespula vulgaris TaxID=7454 RepID=A0A834NLF0_VESVU|nr:hypothetical protein HZH66_000874 [Vespula vulgaris]